MEENKNNKTEQHQPFGLLFNMLGYDSLQEYEAFVQRLNDKSTNDILLVIISALRYAQSRGVYKKVEESETISIAIRKLTEIISHNNA